MPPQYKDGSFRKRGKLLEYRFIYLDNLTGEKQLKSVYGQTEQECYNKRTNIIAGKKQRPRQSKFLKNNYYCAKGSTNGTILSAGTNKMQKVSN